MILTLLPPREGLINGGREKDSDIVLIPVRGGPSETAVSDHQTTRPAPPFPSPPPPPLAPPLAPPSSRRRHQCKVAAVTDREENPLPVDIDTTNYDVARPTLRKTGRGQEEPEEVAIDRATVRVGGRRVKNWMVPGGEFWQLLGIFLEGSLPPWLGKAWVRRTGRLWNAQGGSGNGRGETGRMLWSGYHST